MARHQRHSYLIAYDIADPRRLKRVHRHLRERAVGLQYSVFLAWLDGPELDRLAAELTELIDPKEDDLRVYPLAVEGETTLIGGHGIEDGVGLYEAGRDLLKLQLPKPSKGLAD